MSEFHHSSYSLVGNAFGFLGQPLSRNVSDCDIAVLGIPYDMGTSGRAGTRFGPQGIRAASANLRWEEQRWPWRFALSERLRIIDYGDIDAVPGDSQAMVDAVVDTVDQILSAGKSVLSFGGDHFVTLPLLRAYARHYDDIALVHFDAHTDTESELPSRYYHGSMFYHAPREGLINANHSIQVGIRTEYDPDDHAFEVIDAAWANDQDSDTIVQRIRQRVGERPVYISFDIDCLDPAFAPGTGTPVVGGLNTDKALKILRGLQGLPLIGMDVVEVAPCYDHAEITSLAAATLACEYLYLRAAHVSGR